LYQLLLQFVRDTIRRKTFRKWIQIDIYAVTSHIYEKSRRKWEVFMCLHCIRFRLGDSVTIDFLGVYMYQ